jgi:hypothetical protein
MAWWCAIVGASGSGKTPGLAVTTRVLAEIDRMQRDRIADLRRQHETKLEAAKAAQKKWLAEVEAAVAENTPAPPKPPEATKLGPFVNPRLYVSDATIERLVVLIQARPAGLAMIQDELAGLFANMGRYSAGDDRTFWLEAWNGNPYTIERMGRDPIALDRLLVSLTGGFQPDKIARAFGGDADGFSSRVCFVWPAEAGYRPLSHDVAEVEPEAVNAFMRLAALGELDAEGVMMRRDIRLSIDAGADFEHFRQFLHEQKGSLDGVELEWWAKGPAQVLRIAGTLALVEWAWGGPPEPDEISTAHICNAVELWRDYLWPHSRAALRQIRATRKRSTERRVLLWIKKHRKTEISIKDVRRDALAHAIDAAETERLLDTLASSGWLRKHIAQTGGRPAHRWEVNPTLHARSAQSAESRETVFGAGLGAVPALPAPGEEEADLDAEGWQFNRESHADARQ